MNSVKRNAALGAGVIAGGLALAGGGALLLGPGAASADPAAGKPAAAAAPVAPAADPDQDARDAFFGAGYTYDDAVALAKAWSSSDEFAAKVTAGRKLLAGETLPVAPGSSDPQAAPGATPEDEAITAYFAAGYDYDDAVKLAAVWHTATPYDAKAEAGQKLLDGETLPVQP
jgi:hypothetical protein